MRGAGSIYSTTTEVLFPGNCDYTYYITNQDIEHYESQTNTLFSVHLVQNCFKKIHSNFQKLVLKIRKHTGPKHLKLKLNRI